jgi:serine/threonine protein kinase
MCIDAISSHTHSNLPAHPNVVTFFGLAEGRDQLYIVTEFMIDGSLDKHLIQNRYVVSPSPMEGSKVRRSCALMSFYLPELPSV